MLKVHQLEELDKWIEKLMKYCKIAVVIFALVEVLIFFSFGIMHSSKWQGKIKIYLLDYLLFPTVRNIIIVGLGSLGVRLYSEKRKVIRNYMAMLTVVLMSMNIVYTHSDVVVLIGMMGIPILLTIAVGDKRFTDNIGVISAGLLLLVQIKIVDVHLLSAESIVATIICSAFTLLISYLAAKGLLSYYGDVLQCWEIASEEKKMDPMTGVMCKKAICDELDDMVSTVSGGMLSIALINIDNMKEIIRLGGQISADLTVKKLGDIVKSCTDNHVKIGRFGKDEFVIVFQNHGVMQVITTCERIRDTFYTEEKTVLKDGNASVSIGIATLTHKTRDSVELLIKGKEALKQAKESGKNKTVVS